MMFTGFSEGDVGGIVKIMATYRSSVGSAGHHDDVNVMTYVDSLSYTRHRVRRARGLSASMKAKAHQTRASQFITTRSVSRRGPANPLSSLW